MPTASTRSRPTSCPASAASELRCQEHVIDGLKAAPEGIQVLLNGSNNGKVLVKLCD